MSKSNGSVFGRGRSGSGMILDVRVQRSSARNARVAFILTTVVVALLTMVIGSDRIHPVAALLLGIVAGAALGCVVWAFVRAWPVLRVIWWWTPEIALAIGLGYGWTALADATNLVVHLIVVAAIAAPFVWRPVRRVAWSLVRCLFVRHRLRVCFAQFIIANKSGSLPFILWAVPTPVGERVWIYLRPGLSLTYLQQNAEKIAVACSAASVVIDRVNGANTNAAHLRVDIKRREVLDSNVDSPLPDLVTSTDDQEQKVSASPAGEVPTALD
ncbi:MAG: hypothetical protein J2P17_22845, partial [Mycobacterium sp.]|nr:hypothetical protein [Mycobacterium sp.]